MVPVGARPTVVVLSLREVSARTHAHRALLAGYLAQSAVTGRGKNVFRPNDSFFPVRRSARRLVTLNFLPFCGDASSEFSVRRNEDSNERESARMHARTDTSTKTKILFFSDSRNMNSLLLLTLVS